MPAHKHEGVLTVRQRDVMELVARGLTAKGIARALLLSPHTVRHHIRDIYERLDVGDRVSATVAWMRLKEETR